RGGPGPQGPERPALRRNQYAGAERISDRLVDVHGHLRGHVQGRRQAGRGRAGQGLAGLRDRRRPEGGAAAVLRARAGGDQLRGVLTVMIELLAAVPSVVYGLWGVFFLVPRLRGAEVWVGHTLSFVPFIGLPDDQKTIPGPNYFIAGLILAIMILPLVSAISREVIATVPKENKEAALALGATRWEMIRMTVLPYSPA